MFYLHTVTLEVNCFPTSWNATAEFTAKVGFTTTTIAVDNDFNIYTINRETWALQKWIRSSNTTISLFSGQLSYTPLFYQLSTDSLYFHYTYKGRPGIYKLVNGSSTPIQVFSASGQGRGLDGLSISCGGLYVNSKGDIFVLDAGYRRLTRWKEHGTSGVRIIGYEDGEDSLQFGSARGLVVDEITNQFYIIIDHLSIILRYSEGDINGTVVFGGGPKQFLSTVLSEYLVPRFFLIDKMGHILVAEGNRITRWTPNLEYQGTVVGDSTPGFEDSATSIDGVTAMTFDRLGNLYITSFGSDEVTKFHANLPSCVDNSR